MAPKVHPPYFLKGLFMSYRITLWKRVFWIFTLCLFVFGPSQAAWAEVSLPRIFASHMVLQRDVAVPVWGWADSGEEVTVTLGEHQAKAKANEMGEWKLALPALPVGGPMVMVVTGKNSITLNDILVGEVWLCSGQSNMEMGVGAVANGAQEVAEATYPHIRLFEVNRISSGVPLKDFAQPVGHYETWRVCSPQTIAVGSWNGFSACAYFFGRELYKQLGVPIGLIDSSWGGTLIEPWTPPVGFASVEALASIALDIEAKNNAYAQAVPGAITALKMWLQETEQRVGRNDFLVSPPVWPGHGLNSSGAPTGLYNSMIYPLAPFAIRGAIWYQGESNCGQGMLYFEKMKALIGGWRKVWGQGDFPFYFVQLAPCRYNRGEALPGIWQAQLAALSIPNTGMAVTTDLVDNIQDIHPVNKQDVGKRLALWALAKDYGCTELVYSGPLFKSMAVEGNAVRVHFDHVGEGLITNDPNDPDYFEIAGGDNVFVQADAKIVGDTVVVSSASVSEPVAVRFAWNEEAMPNLFNKEGLPASPFSSKQ